MNSFHHKISGKTKEMQPQQQMYQKTTRESQQSWEADTARRNQIEILKSNLHSHSMRLAEMCTKYTVESHQAEAAQSQELKIIERLKKEIRELQEKLEQTSLKMAAVNSNCQPLQAKVEGTVQFGKALSEHRPRMKKSVGDMKKVRDEEQAAVDALEKEVQVLLADYKALNLKFVGDLTQLREEVHKERETRVTAITQHNQKIAEIESSIKDTQLLSCKEKAINADLQTAIETEQKQIMALKDERERNETEFKTQHTLVQSDLDEMRSRIPKHREGIERGIAMKKDYQKLIILMKELEIDQKESEESLIAIRMEKVQIVKKLELSTNVKMSAEQEISKTLFEIDKCVANEQAMINDKAMLTEKLQHTEENLAEKKIEEFDLKVYLENLNETQMSIDNSLKQLKSKFNGVLTLIERVNLDIQVNEGDLVKGKSQLSEIEEKVNVILGEISRVETDSEAVVKERTEIERDLTETRSQTKQILAAKADLIEQEEAIGFQLGKDNLEKVDLMQLIDEVELEIQSMVNENTTFEEKIKDTKSYSEILKTQVLEKKSDVEALQAMIKSTEEEIKCIESKIDRARVDVEVFTNDFQQTTLLLESAQLAKERATVQNCALKAEFKTANEMKQRKDTEIKIIEDELAINLALGEANQDQAEILQQLKQELTREEEERLKMCAHLQKLIDEKAVATEESLKKLAALEEKKKQDSTAMAIIESDFNLNKAAELEIVCKLKELEASSVAARRLHEESLQAIAEQERIAAAEGSRTLEELKAHLESATEERCKQKAYVESLDSKVKELEKTFADRKLKNHDDHELVRKNKQLKNELQKLEKENQENLESKALRRSGVRAVSKQWFADMAALKDELATEQLKIKELSAGIKSSSIKNTTNAATTSKEKSPKTPTYKEKLPFGKSPIISGSHDVPSSLRTGKVRQVGLWNVNASSTPISIQDSNFQENSSPDEVQNSPLIFTSSIKKKMKIHH